MAKNRSYELKFELDNNGVRTTVSAGQFEVPGGLDTLMYKGVHEVDHESDISSAVYHLQSASFSRVPEANEVFMQIIKVVETSNTYVAFCQVNSVGSTDVIVHILTDTVQLIRGPQGQKGDKGEKGDPFRIVKVFSSVATMQAGAASDGVKVGEFVTIDTGSVNDADTAKLFLKTSATANGYLYLTDLSGAQGIQGPKGDTGERGPQGERGLQGATGATGAAGLVMVGFKSEKINFNAPLGPTQSTYKVGLTADYFNRTPDEGEKVVGYVNDITTDKQAICRNCTVHKQSITVNGQTYPMYIEFSVGDYVIITGVQGEIGPQGATGATGATGKTGETGKTGLQMVKILAAPFDLGNPNSAFINPGLGDMYNPTSENSMLDLTYFNREPGTDESVVGFFIDTVSKKQFICDDCRVVHDSTGLSIEVEPENCVVLSGADGATGPKGATGATPKIVMTAEVNANVGTPSVVVRKSGTDEAPQIHFAFNNLKGQKGDTGPQGPQGISVVKATITPVA